jgi:hypothetical protein
LDPIDRFNYQALDHLSHLGRVRIEKPNDVEALSSEALIAQKRPGQIPDSHQHCAPCAVNPECGTYCSCEIASLVTDAALSQMS